MSSPSDSLDENTKNSIPSLDISKILEPNGAASSVATNGVIEVPKPKSSQTPKKKKSSKKKGKKGRNSERKKKNKGKNVETNNKERSEDNVAKKSENNVENNVENKSENNVAERSENNENNVETENGGVENKKVSGETPLKENDQSDKEKRAMNSSPRRMRKKKIVTSSSRSGSPRNKSPASPRTKKKKVSVKGKSPRNSPARVRTTGGSPRRSSSPRTPTGSRSGSPRIMRYTSPSGRRLSKKQLEKSKVSLINQNDRRILKTPVKKNGVVSSPFKSQTKRFEDIRSDSPPPTRYQQPSEFVTPSKPSLTPFNTSSPRFLLKKDRSPGPDAYKPELLDKFGGSNLGATALRSVTKRFQAQKSLSPAPGQYETTSTFDTSRPSSPFQSKTERFQVPKSHAPDHYYVKSTFEIKNARAPSSPFASHSQRFEKVKNRAPSCTKYNPRNPSSYSPSSPSGAFRSATKRFKYKDSNPVGPADYSHTECNDFVHKIYK